MFKLQFDQLQVLKNFVGVDTNNIKNNSYEQYLYWGENGSQLLQYKCSPWALETSER